MEVKVEINPYEGKVDTVKLNNWLQQLEVYFVVHNVREGKNIAFSIFKLEGHL